MATNNSTAPLVRLPEDDLDAVTLRLEQVGAMISALSIQIRETEEIPVSNTLLSTSLAGFSTFIEDIRNRLIDGIEKGGAA